MRLTLRTLLAYLDDILEPSQTKEIGTKLTESKFATGLVDRIHEVMRRRRLTAPDVLGKGAVDDPNIAAEYLDNTLAPEKIAEFEKACLESDVQLAEAAACHQILTLVLGEPVEIRSESRRRMYKLVGEAQAAESADAAKQHGLAAEEADEAPQKATAAASAAAGEGTPSPADRIPEYLRARPFWRRAAPAVVGLTVLGVLIGLIITDQDFRAVVRSYLPGMQAEETDANADQPRNRAPRNRGNKNREQTAATVQADAGAATRETVQPGGIASGANSKPVGEEATSPAQSIANVDNQAGNSGPAATKPRIEAEHPAPAKPSFSAAVKPAEPPAVAEPRDPVVALLPPKVAAAAVAPPPAKTEPMPDQVELPPDIRYTPELGVLLRFDRKRGDWFVVSLAPNDQKNSGRLYPDDRIASPEPFDSRLEVGDGLCKVLIRGGASLGILGPTPAGSFGFDVRQGRVVIEAAMDADGNASKFKPINFALAVRGQMWRVELTKPGTICGIEILPLQPEKLDQDLVGRNFEGTLRLASGSLRVYASGKAQSLVNPGGISLTPGDQAPKPAVSTSAVENALNAFPGAGKGPAGSENWLNTQPIAMPITSRSAASQFRKEFYEDQPLLLSIAPIVRNTQPRISELAVKTLALTESYSTLVKTLTEVTHEESLDAAINGLRNWLSLSPKNGALLKEELAKVFRSEDAQTVYRLLWGFGKDDALNREASLQLVNLLEHDELVVRQLAFYHIRRLTGQKQNYHPNMSVSQRAAFARRLRTSIENNDGLLRKNGSKRSD